MFLDPDVEREKFEAELDRIRRSESRLRELGAILVRAEAPEIDILFVPRLPLRMAFPAAQTPTGVSLPPGTLTGLEFQSLSARAFGVRFGLDGYDVRAPSISFRDPWSWQSAAMNALPIAQLVDATGKGQVVLLDGHPTTRRPFLCVRGVREYHEHPQHSGDDWAIYRSSINVMALIERIGRLMILQTRPQLILNAAGHLQLQWAAGGR